MDASEVYAQGRGRVVDLLTSAPAEDLDRTVPATPDWTARDVLAHLVGEQSDILAGVLPTPGGEWQANQVATRKGRSVDELVAEWREGAARFEAMLKGAPETLAGAMAADVVQHELDLRAALGRPLPLDDLGEAVDFGVNLMAGFLDRRIKKAELPALRVAAGNQEWTLGSGEPAAALKTAPVEFFRVLAGRRSEAQVRALTWEGDPSPYLPVLSAFGPLAAADVPEQFT